MTGNTYALRPCFAGNALEISEWALRELDSSTASLSTGIVFAAQPLARSPAQGEPGQSAPEPLPVRFETPSGSPHLAQEQPMLPDRTFEGRPQPGAGRPFAPAHSFRSCPTTSRSSGVRGLGGLSAAGAGCASRRLRFAEASRRLACRPCRPWGRPCPSGIRPWGRLEQRPSRTVVSNNGNGSDVNNR
jgi:hypothetical protein